ncbi:hypothetical protein BGZ63DRAFT_392997, partial [Mariannaea sp. PMI_226]
MYCSKCLRRVPKARDGVDRDAEIVSHSDPDRCCRIRNAVGEPENLPNRSGWLPEKTVRRKLKDIKERFKKKYPAYQYTIYPTNPVDSNQSLWRSDPNNENNASHWEIPWPPYEGQPPLPGGWEDPGTPVFDTPSKRRTPRSRPERDASYRPPGEEPVSDDEELPPQEEARKKSPKRKRKSVAAESEASGSRQRGQAREHVEHDEAEPAVKRPKTDTSGKGKQPVMATPKPKAPLKSRASALAQETQPTRSSKRIRQRRERD